MRDGTHEAGDARVAWLERALAEHEAPLLRYAASLTGDADRARDAVQDTFLRLCGQEPAALNGRLAPWLFTVCRRRIIDRQRKESPMQPLADTFEEEAATTPDPAAAAAAHDTGDALLGLLARLPGRQREVVHLRFQEQLSYAEIAEVTGLTATNVGFLLHTTLRALRRQLAELESPARG
ncbi:MAG: RNA polymerase sigma factor [Limisphaerales bacterium]